RADGSNKRRMAYSLHAPCAHGARPADHPVGCRRIDRCTAAVGAMHLLRPQGRDLDVAEVGRLANGLGAVPGRGTHVKGAAGRRSEPRPPVESGRVHWSYPKNPAAVVFDLEVSTGADHTTILASLDIRLRCPPSSGCPR